MTNEQIAYISIFDFWNKRMPFSLSQWLKARDASRNNVKMKQLRNEILSSKDKLEKIKNKYFKGE